MKRTEEEIHLNQTHLLKTNGELTLAMAEMKNRNDDIAK